MRVVAPAVRSRDGRLFLLPHMARATSFAVMDTSTGTVELVQNPYAKGEEVRGRGRSVAAFILGLRPDVVVLKEAGEGMISNLRAAGVRVHVTDKGFLDEALKALGIDGPAAFK